MSGESIRPLTRAAVREIDRRAVEEFGVPGLVLMENAGRGAAHLIQGLLRGPRGARVAIACGGGNNAGDGFVIARHLHNAGIEVELLLAVDPARLSGDAATNCDIVSRMRIPTAPLWDEAGLAANLPRLQLAQVVVDALLGTGSSGAPRPPMDRVIRAINQLSAATVVAIDLPSGLDCDTGVPADPTVRANMTITFVAPKVGFAERGAAAYTGKVHVVDIGAPRELLSAAL
ncbi:MAG: NAD(P)H-hydrate epimerase [Phycisphaerae bacterium]|nr:NAD(P)H-hydrate epimerase [Phycisphaerae bacterium]